MPKFIVPTMSKQFWQCDVTDREGNIWTGSVYYGSHQEAEYMTMLELQQDWGDDYVPDGFVERFGSSESENAPPFVGDDAWDELGFWDELDVNIFMLPLPPIVALARLGKIMFDVNDEMVEEVMAGRAHLTVAYDAD